MPTRPSRPEPKSQTAAGTGTAVELSAAASDKDGYVGVPDVTICDDHTNKESQRQSHPLLNQKESDRSRQHSENESSHILTAYPRFIIYASSVED